MQVYSARNKQLQRNAGAALQIAGHGVNRIHTSPTPS
jgi:hypothetical protein